MRLSKEPCGVTDLQDQTLLPSLGMERSLQLGWRLPGTSLDKQRRGGLPSARDSMFLHCSGAQESGRLDQSQGLRPVITLLGNSNKISQHSSGRPAPATCAASPINLPGQPGET